MLVSFFKQLLDPSLDENMLNGKKIDRLMTLNEYIIGNLFKVFMIIIILLVILILVGSGYHLYSRDVEKQKQKMEKERQYKITKVFTSHGIVQNNLNNELRSRERAIKAMKGEIDERTQTMDELYEMDSKNRETITKLNQDKYCAPKEHDHQAPAKATRRPFFSIGNWQI